MDFSFKKFRDDEVNTAGTKANLEKLAGEIADMNYTKFTEGEDYASLEERYSRQGRRAMDDTMGMAAARTGGLASSYAVAAGNQAYSGYMEKLEDAARAMYDDQRQEKIDQFGIEQSIYAQNYKEKQDWIDNTFRQTSYDNERADKMISDEKTALASEFYHSPYAYATFADYKKAFPNTLLTESDFNQIKGTSIGQYNEDNKKFNVEAKENEEEKLYDAIYNNANIYPDYASYKEAFPNSLLSKADFERILSTASVAWAEEHSSSVTSSEACQKIHNLLAVGTPLDEIDSNLIAASGYDASYWNLYSVAMQATDDEEEFTKYIYTGTQDDYGNNVFQYGAGGESFSFAPGVNPYTGSTNPDTKNGTFSNGYQPNNINGERLEKTGITDEINGVTQNVWQTPDGTKWIWDGTQNKYLKYIDSEEEEPE